MSEIQSLAFYMISFSLSAILVYLGSLSKFANIELALFRKIKVNLFTLLGLMIPILIGGLLYNVGIDYDGYIMLFEKSNELNYAGFLAYNDFWTVEPSFYVIARISMFLTNSSWLMFGIYSAINITFFYLFLKRLIPKHRAFGFFIYLFVFYLFTMTLMRQGAAIAVCFYALTFLFDKKYVKYLMLVGAAFLLHFSALFFAITGALSLFIKPAKSNWLPLVLLTVGGLLIVASPHAIQLVTSIPPFDKYVYLLDKNRDDVLIGWTFLLQLGIVSGISVLFYKMARKYTHAALLFSMLLIGIIAYSLNFRIDYASRVSYFFLPASTVLIPYAVGVFQNNRVLKTLIVLGCMAYFIKIYFLGNTLMVFPYSFAWSA